MIIQSQSCDALKEKEDHQITMECGQLYIMQSSHQHGRTKHIEIIYHFIREKVLDETVELKYCPTNDMIADMLTKGVSHEKFHD